MMTDKPKCSKPGCGAINAIGEACLDHDCPQMWVHYTVYNAEIERLTRELSEAVAQLQDIERKLLDPHAVRINWLYGRIDCSNLISEARAAGRAEGMEEAARMLADKAAEIRANDNPTSTAMAMIFEEQAADIRAAKEK